MLGRLNQQGLVEPRENPTPHFVGQKTRCLVGAIDGYGATAFGANTNNGNREGGVAKIADFTDMLDAVREHQDASFNKPRIAEQFLSQLQSAGRAATQYRHHGRRQRTEQVFNGVSVIGNGYHGMTVAGVGDQAGGTFLSKTQRVDNFLSCFIQSRGRKILRKHGQGQIQNDD